jgi:hypothetical protein
MPFGHGSHDENLADAAVGDEPLGSVHHEVAVLTNGGRARATRVASGILLGEPESA